MNQVSAAEILSPRPDVNSHKATPVVGHCTSEFLRLSNSVEQSHDLAKQVPGKGIPT